VKKTGKKTRFSPEEVHAAIDSIFWPMLCSIFDGATLDEKQEWVFENGVGKGIVDNVKNALNPKHWKLPFKVVGDFLDVVNAACAALWYNGDGEYVITFDVASDKYTIKTNGYQCW